jgi:hypothetical protein
MATILAFGFVLMCSLGIASILARRELKELLKNHDPVIYERLKIGLSAIDRSPRDSMAFAAYILRRKQWGDSDSPEFRLHKRARAFDISYYAVFILLVAGLLGFFL